MEAASGVSTGRVMPSSPPVKKEWRIISENSSRTCSSDDFERSKLGQSEEKALSVVQQGDSALDIGFYFMKADESSNNEFLEQRLDNVSRQREELQRMEIDIQAQLIARTQIFKMQKRNDEQIKEKESVIVKLKEQLHEREHHILELEKKLELMDRELHTIKIDKEAAWAKEDLLREQTKELTTVRRELDNSESERIQHLKQIHDLKEHIHEKDRHFLELKEKHRDAQETIMLKDEQLREAHVWIQHSQEISAFRSNANQSLQAELHERTNQLNQLWIGHQRQLEEMKQHHLHAIRQLQLELTEANERSDKNFEELQVDQSIPKEVTTTVGDNGNVPNIRDEGALSESLAPNNGDFNDTNRFVSTDSTLSKNNHASSVPLAEASILGTGPYLPSRQTGFLHPFAVHQMVSEPQANASYAAQFHTNSLVSSHQNWQYHLGALETSQMSNHHHYYQSHSSDGKDVHLDHVTDYVDPHQVSNPAVTLSGEVQNIIEISSHLHNTLGLNIREQENDYKDCNGTTKEQLSDSNMPSNSSLNHSPVEPIGPSVSDANSVTSIEHVSKSSEPEKKVANNLLDEKALLACIVRAIPAGSGGQIRISTTLTNRLAKMLAPLHWHDYKKHFGKLNEFVLSHPELFVIEGDFIHLQDGAQEIISATAAIAKVAAAAASISPLPLLPSLAVTPVAQARHLRKTIAKQGTKQNESCSHLCQGLSNVKILSKSKESVEVNGLPEHKKTDSFVHNVISNGSNVDKVNSGLFPSKDLSYEKPHLNSTEQLIRDRSTGNACRR